MKPHSPARRRCRRDAGFALVDLLVEATIPVPFRTRSRGPQIGSTSLVALFLALVVAGLSVGLVHESRAARAAVSRQETSCKALEIAEAAVCRAEVEIRARRDAETDGIGNVKGAYAGGSYDVKTANDSVSPDRFVVTAKGTHGHSVRRIEVFLRRRSSSLFAEALFSKNQLSVNGNVTTDAYDSSLGAYAAQAVNVDAYGTYALAKGDVGSNVSIALSGSSPVIRGNAIPGPGYEVTESGSPVVTGDTLPREAEVSVPVIPQSTFQAAMTTNDNGNWIVTGGSILYNSSRFSMRVNSGTTLTLPGGTYFFSDFVLRSNAILNVMGPCKIYVTGSFDLTAGALINPGGKPADLQVYAHPYPLPTTYDPPTTEVKISGHPQCAVVVYAPEVNVTISGNSDFFGSIVASVIGITGSPYFHYDVALEYVERQGAATLERFYWREITPPRR